MEIKKYSISEEMAATAKQLMSFSEYKPNEATNSYLRLLNRFTEAVENLISKYGKTATADQLELVEYYADKYSQKLAAAINRENQISAMCPSIMVSGAGNFPVRKKEKQNAAMEKFWAENGELFDPTENYYYKKIRTLLSNDTIYSNDALALEKLQNKLKDLEENYLKMKEYNAYYRKHKTLKGYEGLSDKEAERLDIQIKSSWYQQPFAPYELTNSNGRIKQTKDRIAELIRLKENAEKPVENKYPQVNGVEVVENAEAMRIQLIFDNKPCEEIRNVLKSNGFRWSPTYNAWQRQLTANGVFATKQMLKKLKEMEDK